MSEQEPKPGTTQTSAPAAQGASSPPWSGFAPVPFEYGYQPLLRPPASLTLVAALSNDNFMATDDKDGCIQCDGLSPDVVPCCFTTLRLRCGHGERKFILVPPDTKTNKACDQIIQMVADKESARGFGATSDTLIFQIDGGPCNRGREGYPRLTIDGKEFTASGSVDLDAFVPETRAELHLGAFLRRFLSADPRNGASTYTGSIQACEGGAEHGFQVQVYPKRKWHGSVRLSFGEDTTRGIGAPDLNYDALDAQSQAWAAEAGVPAPPPVKREKKIDPLKPKDDDHANVTFSLDLKAQEGGHKSEVTVPFKTPGKESEQGFGFTRRVFSRVHDQFDKLGNQSDLAQFKILWPNLVMGGGAELKEHKDKYSVYWEGHVGIKADPLIGAEGKFDLLTFFLRMAPAGVGLLVDEVRKQLAKGKKGKTAELNAVLSLDLIGKGTIGGEIQFRFGSEIDSSAAGEIVGEFTLSIRGEISARLRFWVVSFESGYVLSAEAKTGAKITGDTSREGPALKGCLYFKGIYITGVYFGSVGGKFEGTAPPQTTEAEQETASAAREDKDNEKSRSIEPKAKEKKEHFRIQVLGPWQWPAKERAALADEGAI